MAPGRVSSSQHRRRQRSATREIMATFLLESVSRLMNHIPRCPTPYWPVVSPSPLSPYVSHDASFLKTFQRSAEYLNTCTSRQSRHPGIGPRIRDGTLMNRLPRCKQVIFPVAKAMRGNWKAFERKKRGIQNSSAPRNSVLREKHEPIACGKQCRS